MEVKRFLQQAAGGFLRRTGLEYLPVRVRNGLPAGARWTLYPWTSYWRGGYEPAVGRAIEGLGDLAGKVCWDLGAHYGFYSVGLALRTGPTGQVVAFEPLARSFERLDRHARMNALAWLVRYRAALSDVTGETTFVLDGGETTSHLPYDGEVVAATGNTIKVQTYRLDDLVDAGAIRTPDFIKVDIEGHGHRALAGAIDSIRQKRPVILMGFHSPQEVAGTETLLASLGYRFDPVDPAVDPVGRIGADYLLRPE